MGRSDMKKIVLGQGLQMGVQIWTTEGGIGHRTLLLWQGFEVHSRKRSRQIEGFEIGVPGGDFALIIQVEDADDGLFEDGNEFQNETVHAQKDVFH